MSWCEWDTLTEYSNIIHVKHTVLFYTLRMDIYFMKFRIIICYI